MVFNEKKQGRSAATIFFRYSYDFRFLTLSYFFQWFFVEAVQIATDRADPQGKNALQRAQSGFHGNLSFCGIHLADNSQFPGETAPVAKRHKSAWIEMRTWPYGKRSPLYSHKAGRPEGFCKSFRTAIPTFHHIPMANRFSRCKLDQPDIRMMPQGFQQQFKFFPFLQGYNYGWLKAATKKARKNNIVLKCWWQGNVINISISAYRTYCYIAIKANCSRSGNFSLIMWLMIVAWPAEIGFFGFHPPEIRQKSPCSVRQRLLWW